MLLVTCCKRGSNVTFTTLHLHLYTTYTLRGDNVVCKLGTPTVPFLENFYWAFARMDPVNGSAEFDVRSFTHS